MLLLLFSQNEAVVAPEVPLIPPGGGGGGKRKTLRLRTRTDEEIRRLKENVHKKRRTIWERPKPEEREAPATKEMPLAAVAYVDTSFRETGEIAEAVVDLVRARLEIEAERQARREADVHSAEERRVAREVHIAEIRRIEAEAEALAVMALLMAA